jgi:glycosyltransferase involved in cell wall biosynthesis
MNVLNVTIGVPHPQRGGGANRSFQLLRHLQAGGDRVRLICVAMSNHEHDLDAARELCEHVALVPSCGDPPWRPRLRSGHATLDRYLTLLAEPPYRYAHTFAAALRVCVRAQLAATAIDCLVAETTCAAFLLAPIARTGSIPAVADLHDIDSVAHARSSQLEGPTTGPWVLAKRTVTTQKIRAAERTIAATYPLCVVASHHDAAALDRVAGRRVRAVAVPNGVDTASFQPLCSVSAQADTLVFTGLMAHAPNADGVRYFCAEVLPLIWQRRPSVRLLVVGTDPPPDVRALDQGATGRVRVLGAVPDTRPYLAESRVAVVPLRSGSGTRLKILEALAMERPVVSTTIGVEGLEVVDDQHLLIADQPAAFAAAVLRLLEDRVLARRLAAEGRALVERRYRWDAIGTQWQRHLHDLARRLPPTPARAPTVMET